MSRIWWAPTIVAIKLTKEEREWFAKAQIIDARIGPGVRISGAALMRRILRDAMTAKPRPRRKAGR